MTCAKSGKHQILADKFDGKLCAGNDGVTNGFPQLFSAEDQLPTRVGDKQRRNASPAAEGQGCDRCDRPHRKSLLSQTLLERIDFERGLPLIIRRCKIEWTFNTLEICLLYTSPSPRDRQKSR